MNEYQVQIRELLVMTVTVEAENTDQARRIVEKRWLGGDYVLDAEHLKGITFSSRKDKYVER